MISTAKARYIRISPFKVRDVLRLIKGKSVDEAKGLLRHTNKRATVYIHKVLKSAVSNAENKGAKIEELYISKAFADGGPVLMRYKAAPFGRATSIRRRTAHIVIELGLEKDRGTLEKKAAAKKEKPKTAKKTTKPVNKKSKTVKTARKTIKKTKKGK